jgi:hypothetical protein
MSVAVTKVFVPRSPRPVPPRSLASLSPRCKSAARRKRSAAGQDGRRPPPMNHGRRREEARQDASEEARKPVLWLADDKKKLVMRIGQPAPAQPCDEHPGGRDSPGQPAARAG